jgi:LAS superfamily LD-carboxypeptidase LdcB
MKLHSSLYSLFILALWAMAFQACDNAHGENQSVNQPEPKSQPEAAEPAEQVAEPEDDFDFTISYLMGQFDPAAHPDFVKVDDKYTDGDPYYLRKDTYAAFQKMWDAAMADGIKLVIISATRNFDRQKMIWEAKWTGTRKIENGANAAEKYPDPVTRALKILEYSSMPGTSRHHWGTDIDLNDLDNYTFEAGPGKPVYEWLSKNAAQYGFCQPYSPKGADRPEGYNEEKWHWSYMPVSEPLTRFAEKNLKNEMISGFLGAETATKIGVVEKYVLGINPACRQ